MPTENHRLFIDSRGRQITGLGAKEKYPDPQFFMRGDMRMSRDEICRLVLRNAEEMRFVLYMLESPARPDAKGSKFPKSALLETATRLHDWRVSVDMHGGGPGQPYLWEV
jgi:hypothetical protein